MTNSRYPYTYACDYVRSLAGYNSGGTKISRSDASQIRSGIAAALGIEDSDLARKLADYYKANEDSIIDRNVRESLSALGLNNEGSTDE